MNVKKPQEPKKPLNSHPVGDAVAAQDLLAVSSSDPALSLRSPQDAKNNEFGGRGGAEPTRFGDYEINGKCVDF